MSTSNNLGVADLASDLTSLSRLSSPLQAIITPNTQSGTHQVAETQSALSRLEEYTPSTTDHDTSQALSEAYVLEMKRDVLSMDPGEGENLGERIDAVRERAEGISLALGEVKV
jgi:hypothetical protein